jgi:GTPase SAR1 family protein
MPITLQSLKRSINPLKTALVLGAGASVPSGAPTGAQLAAELWRRLAKSDPMSDDLVETASILSRLCSRRDVVDRIIAILGPLQPTGGLLGLPKFGWKIVFTTNFDRLIELAYKQNGISHAVIRSNYDFSTRETDTGTRILKIHGCITQDVSLGDKGSMLLTEQDYESHERYRQSMFSRLQDSLDNGDVLIIGQSLRDRHLLDLVKRALAARREGAPGQVYVLVYEKDDLRAPLLEDRGARITFGGIDELVHAFAEGFDEKAATLADKPELLPVSLVSTVYDVGVQINLGANVTRMFNGAPAAYSDIHVGATFERAQQAAAVESLVSGSVLATVITGAAGVGKTTLARRILVETFDRGLIGWEHKSDFPFQQKPWMDLEAKLRAADRTGVLLLDECTHYMRQTNLLIDHLAQIEKPALRVILTANSALWAPRLKTPNMFSRTMPMELSRLNDPEINSLLNLLQNNHQIAALVDPSFKCLSRGQQFQSLRQKCGADMFVCLKNIFANESLDIILLTEYSDLDEASQEYYRYVAALEAVGARVHRQLLIRMLNISPTHVAGILDRLSGIVDEHDIDPRNGLYGWATRHLVIARKIAEYKFSSLNELASLFEKIIDNINPSVPLELQTIRGICDSEFGIGRLGDVVFRETLYRRLIEVAPGERIPWHRLIRTLLDEGKLDDTEYVIRNAEEAVGADGPIDRYKVRLLMVRAQKTSNILEGDRLALLRKAYELAMQNTDKHKWDKLSFSVLCEVAVMLVERGESPYLLQEAIAKMGEAAGRILDPDMTRRLGRFEETWVRLR